jgi:membrane associated rhomboid family serine protease
LNLRDDNSNVVPFTSASKATESGSPFLNIPAIVKLSVLALILVHIFVYWINPSIQAYAIYGYSFIPARFSSTINVPQLPGAAYWSALSYSFLHGSGTHLLVNSLWLLVFGTPVARRLPGWRFLAIAGAGSIGGALTTLAFHWNELVILIGASAAVSALMAAAVPIMFGNGSLLRRLGTEQRARATTILPFRELIENRSALAFMAMFLGLTLLTGATQFVTNSALIGENAIAWEAHIGGFVFGLAAFYLLDKGPVSASQ